MQIFHIFDGLNKAMANFFLLIHDKIVFAVIPNKDLSYGIAIILFTFLIRTILLPLNVKQIKTSFKTQEVQPELKKLQDKYKNDPQKLQAETMKLYQEKGINIFAGCLPMLIQYPILVALFFAFRNIPNLAGVHFLWIKDLSKIANRKDMLSYILPILSAITTYLSYTIMNITNNKDNKNTPADTTNPMSSGSMGIIMSIFMAWMTTTVSSALALYWVVGNIFMIGQTQLVKVIIEYEKKKEEKV